MKTVMEKYRLMATNKVVKKKDLRASADPDASHKVFLVHTNNEPRTYTTTIFGRTVHNLTKEEYEIINGPLFID